MKTMRWKGKVDTEVRKHYSSSRLQTNTATTIKMVVWGLDHIYMGTFTAVFILCIGILLAQIPIINLYTILLQYYTHIRFTLPWEKIFITPWNRALQIIVKAKLFI